MQCRVADLRYKEVINVRTGERLGYVADVLLDTQTGRVLALVVPGRYRLLGLFGRSDDCIVQWESIKRIGEDIILIDAPEQRRDRRKRRGWDV